jgi:hypothetical protein
MKEQFVNVTAEFVPCRACAAVGHSNSEHHPVYPAIKLTRLETNCEGAGSTAAG